ncbi:hypothetical protein L3X38_033600 [Prunus dulcis]|uniref:Uncharacterized protein n=1 Tax=Prunus dulcis TaxID=3755 RepID=A0AAD4VIN7_PRUDU|nr:hypothetical protein L3X38_033600 [Prunus dulcis]
MPSRMRDCMGCADNGGGAVSSVLEEAVDEVELFSKKTDEEFDSTEIGLRLCYMLGDIFNVLPCNQEEEALVPKLVKFGIGVKELISKNQNFNSNGFVQKIISGLKLIHSKMVRDASASNDDPFAYASASKAKASASASKDPSASASKKAGKELFLKNLFKKALNSVLELEPEQQGVHPDPEPEPEHQGLHPETEPIFQEEFEVEFDRDRLLSEILEVMNDFTPILAEIDDLSAVTEKSNVPLFFNSRRKFFWMRLN